MYLCELRANANSPNLLHDSSYSASGAMDDDHHTSLLYCTIQYIQYLCGLIAFTTARFRFMMKTGFILSVLTVDVESSWSFFDGQEMSICKVRTGALHPTPDRVVWLIGRMYFYLSWYFSWCFFLSFMYLTIIYSLLLVLCIVLY